MLLIAKKMVVRLMGYNYDVVILGGGPAGLAAALGSFQKGAKTLIVEREGRPGGILKQCIHDGFGVITFKEKLSGPEYAERYIKMVKENNIPIFTSTYVIKVKKTEEIFHITLVNSTEGIFEVTSKALILANGCRERTSKQVFISGTRPAGVYTAGTAQYFVNVLGHLPCKKCVILGSGDIGLIMARRLTLEGAEVVGVYEAKSAPSGLSRNIAQCLEDYSIPLHLSHTITRIIGEERVEAVEISKVDENMNPIAGTEEIVKCDGVILSVGLIPENEIAESLGIRMDKGTKGPIVDQNFMTEVEGVFSCGNALHVNDLVDYVSESGKFAGENAAVFVKEKENRFIVAIDADYNSFLYVVPQQVNLKSSNTKTVLYFRSKDIQTKATVLLTYKDKVLFHKKYAHLKPPEMERIEVDIKELIKDKEEVGIFQLKMINEN